eukprot:TRINITY_DN3687_c0_g1_i1.p1 TRINITY_DN3687_c0_g1~~TRINITY_DN3687_c0_g1_i1.p1  ORF type:complete len:217 (+),score=46.38 TRINITY_DN3687_c0_g1_i1:122-772(+)
MGDSEDDSNGYCEPSLQGTIFTCCVCLCILILITGIGLVDWFYLRNNFEDSIVNGECMLKNEQNKELADECVGFAASKFRTAVCSVGLNVTRLGSTISVPSEVHLLFKVDDEGKCKGFFRRRRLVSSTEDVGRALGDTQCDDRIRSLDKQAFDCTFAIRDANAVNLELQDNRVLVMKAEDVQTSANKIMMITIVCICGFSCCSLAGLCVLISKQFS